MAVATLTPARALRRPRRADPRALVGVVLTLTALAGSVAFWVSASDARPVIVATRDLPPGAMLRSSDLSVAYVRMDDVLYRAAVPADMLDGLVGRQLAEPMHAQQVLARAQLADQFGLAPDQVASYAWVDERDPSGVTLREHFRRLFQQASVRLAELYATGGDIDAALDLYRELSEIDPGDERLWRALFRLHAERGDRLALMREERRMREALRELADEVDDQPGAQFQEASRETVQEYQRLLASLGEREREREPATA